ncbi:MAG TPA: hypothetical protein VGQ53_07850 [Chitinophagaceae bacterium]|jgi:hypothetical protein|nr:hypothetical protein [Chitinophagaceae bacterium]
MTEKKPTNLFYFYEELITQGVTEISNEFSGQSETIYFGTGENKKEEKVIFIGLTPYSFVPYLKHISKSASRNVMLKEESILAESSPGNLKVHLAKYYSNLDYYIAHLKKLPVSDKYPFFKDDLENIKSDSLEKFRYLDPVDSMPSEIKIESGKPDKETATYKIKWKANINVLSTLFFDLLNGQDKNPAIIEAGSAKVIQDFLIDNFIDAKGKPLSKSSIETHFSTEKRGKRAKKGDRIEITNVKLK